jgi:16S rRNA processing protein RimM
VSRDARAEGSLIEIGGIARAHGIRGEVAIFTHDPDSQTLGSVREIVVGGKRMAIESARATPRGWLVALAGVATRNEAEALRGLVVEVDRSALELAPDDILLVDLIGCRVQLVDGTPWGVVAAVEADYQDRLIIHDDRRSVALPLVDELVLAIDLPNRLITVDPPSGLPEEPL